MNDDKPLHKTGSDDAGKIEPDEIEMTRKNIITRDPDVMGGKPCIRGQRITVGAILGHLSSGRKHEEILVIYPTLNNDDILAALEYAMWVCQDVKVKV